MGKHKSALQESLQLFQHGDYIGQSRREAKKDGSNVWKVFHSDTFYEYVGTFARVLQFARQEFQIHQVKDLTPEHISAFIRSLNDRDLANSTIQKYVATINKADAIAKHIGWRPAEANPLVRAEPKGPRLSSTPEPYTPQEADAILANLLDVRDRRFAALVQVQRGAGLRVREACALTVKAVSPDGTMLFLSKPDKTKKGRPRIVPIVDEKTQQVLKRWRKVAVMSRHTRLFVSRTNDIDGLVRDYQKGIKWVTDQLGIDHSKTHDLRKLFAQERLEYYQNNGLSTKEALQQLSSDLGHGRSRMEHGLLLSYLPQDE